MGEAWCGGSGFKSIVTGKRPLKEAWMCGEYKKNMTRSDVVLSRKGGGEGERREHKRNTKWRRAT